MTKKRSEGSVRVGLVLAVVGSLSLATQNLNGQSPYEDEWTRFHPHFMGHTEKASVELRPNRKVIAIASVQHRENLEVEVSLERGRSQNEFDLYLALSVEGDTTLFDERVHFLTSAGEYTGRPQPYEANVRLTADRKETVHFPIYSGLQPRAYTIYGVLVPPGSDPFDSTNWIQIASSTFAVRGAFTQPIEVSEQGNFYLARDTTFPSPDWLPPEPLVVGPLGANQGMYVNYQAPAKRTQPYPIVFIHG